MFRWIPDQVWDDKLFRGGDNGVMFNELPPDFRDRPHRWWYNLLVLLRIQTVKPVCCEKFRRPDVMQACKGCATLYDKNSSSGFYRFLGRYAKLRAPKPALSTPVIPSKAEESLRSPKKDLSMKG